jgi:Tol biopolymer transport system component/DNA-binding winged helix-turn-helix (wHTH) protein
MTDRSGSAPRVIRFGVFELDHHARELRKAGVRLRLPAQSVEVLTLLLERSGDLVTREELRERLWPTGTFVDFDHGLNAAVNRLRETLGDSADRPRFIETVPRRGYRFVGALEHGSPGRPGIAEPTPSPASVGQLTAAFVRTRRVLGVVAVAIAGLLVLAGGAWYLRHTPAVNRASASLVRLTSLAGTEDWPAFSPDGQQVAFRWDGEKHDNPDIYVTLVGSRDVRRLTTHPADDYAPSWSPDGRHIAFLRQAGSGAYIHVVSALGGPDLRLSDFPVAGTLPFSPAASRISWSPDGRYVAAGRDPRSSGGTPAGIHLIPLRGGEPRALTRPKRPTFDFSPAFSPDARFMAYASCDKFDGFSPWYYPTTCRVRVVGVNGTLDKLTPARTLTPHPSDQVDGPTWSRDGKSVVFYQAGTDLSIWRAWVTGERPAERIELAGGHALHPATVGARDRLMFSQFDWDTHLYRFRAALPDEQIAASSSFETDPHFSPDGRRIAFASNRSGDVTIWVAAADGTGAHQLTHGTGFWQGSPHWSPDGHAIAFDAFDADGHVNIWAIDADGGAPRQITRGEGGQTVPTWSHDGQWIYFSDDRGGTRNVWRVRARGGVPEQISHDGSGFLAIESHDGTSLLHQPHNGDSALLLLPLTGGQPRQLVACVRTAAFAAAGPTVIYVPCEPGPHPALHAIDIVSGRDRLLGRLERFEPNTPHVNLAVSPDGEMVIYRGQVRKGADLMMIENFR